MIGNVFEVEEIDEGGQAWVTMWWNSDDGEPDGHGIGLAPSEMELLLDDIVQGRLDPHKIGYCTTQGLQHEAIH